MGIDPQCGKCPLCVGRTNVVGPSGDSNSKLVFIGEAPGATEDRIGKPFVGRAGKILDRLLAENGLPREKILITNAVKCRPPNNRRPTKQEVEACRPYLDQDLRGRCLVVAMGLTASEDLLGRKVSLKTEANQVFQVKSGEETVNVLVTYHPSACIYNPKAIKVLSDAIALAMERCGIIRSQSIS